LLIREIRRIGLHLSKEQLNHPLIVGSEKSIPPTAKSSGCFGTPMTANAGKRSLAMETAIALKTRGDHGDEWTGTIAQTIERTIGIPGEPFSLMLSFLGPVITPKLQGIRRHLTDSKSQRDGTTKAIDQKGADKRL
jgi:hypothetical protein